MITLGASSSEPQNICRLQKPNCLWTTEKTRKMGIQVKRRVIVRKQMVKTDSCFIVLTEIPCGWPEHLFSTVLSAGEWASYIGNELLQKLLIHPLF